VNPLLRLDKRYPFLQLVPLILFSKGNCSYSNYFEDISGFVNFRSNAKDPPGSDSNHWLTKEAREEEQKDDTVAIGTCCW
jgi:hypothetical protein